MISQIRVEKQQIQEKYLYVKTLEVPIGGSILYLDIPNSPLAYVSETNGIIYINGSAYWESELHMLEDLKEQLVQQVEELTKATNRKVIKSKDIFIEYDEKKEIEKRKFYLLLDDKTEIGFYYNLHLPNENRNGIIEIIPYYKQCQSEVSC